MSGGTLVISRAINNHPYYKKRLEALGFKDITFTALERDALYFFIRDMKPNFIIIGARFFQCSTPYVMGELKKRFPEIKMVALSLSEYPLDLAMYFVINGVNSYITLLDGMEQFYKGLEDISRGKDYVSPAVMERIHLRKDYPDPARNITDRHKEIIRLLCCGYRDIDIAETLAISKSTVENHKTDIYTSLNVRNVIELIRAALTLGIVKIEEIYFYPKDFSVNPLPEKKSVSAASKPYKANRRKE